MRTAVGLSMLLFAGCYQAVPEIDTAGGSSGTTGAAGTTTSGQTASVASSTSGHATTVGTAIGAGTTGTNGGLTAASTTSTGTGTTSGVVSSSVTVSSSGTSGDAGCALSDCPAGQVELRGSLTNLCTGSPETGTSIVQNLLNPTQIATSDSTGDFFFCVDPGTLVAPQVEVSGAEATILPTIDAQQSACLGSFPLVCTSILAVLGESLPDFNPALATVFVQTRPLSPVGSCADETGWGFTLFDSTGQFIDAGSASVLGTSLSPGDSTGPTGIVIFYNIPSTLGPLSAVEGVQAASALPDGGTLCPNIGADYPTQLTGGLLLQDTDLSYFPYVVP